MGTIIKKGEDLLSHILLILTTVLIFHSAANPNQKELISVSLRRNDSYFSGVTWSSRIQFNQEEVKAILKNRPLRLPASLSPDTKIGLTVDGIYTALEKLHRESVIRLTIDGNRNDDLTDDKSFEIKDKEFQPIRILRHYTIPKERQIWLPYKAAYYQIKRTDGTQEDLILITANYCMEGSFRINGNEYFITIADMYSDGKFYKKDFMKETCMRIDIKNYGEMKEPEEVPCSQELIQIGEKFYKILDVTEDGSKITFIKSKLRPAVVGREAPDFLLTDINGKKFSIQEMRGKVVLLDFWGSWCKPCVKKFPDVKKLYEVYQDSSFIIIGISLDDKSREKKCLELIESHGLPWIQVIEGKASSSPIWRSYGRIGGNLGIPLLVIIDSSGIIKYAGHNMEEIKSLLNKLINNKT